MSVSHLLRSDSHSINNPPKVDDRVKFTHGKNDTECIQSGICMWHALQGASCPLDRYSVQQESFRSKLAEFTSILCKKTDDSNGIGNGRYQDIADRRVLSLERVNKHGEWLAGYCNESDRPRYLWAGTRPEYGTSGGSSLLTP
ncbi:hypothetical protein EVAR_81559_1 [Eumeta japonica]|uniref:Uncharacterized protein n=1 Tax=Eumeta variegata TaxID=151549 RepID=A0A4C1UZ66_EUMVA|nr:hypothetical protein EVAR_81559_1 [Eumeta japonica]